jgi:hypothetical protein
VRRQGGAELIPSADPAGRSGSQTESRDAPLQSALKKCTAGANGAVFPRRRPRRSSKTAPACVQNFRYASASDQPTCIGNAPRQRPMYEERPRQAQRLFGISPGPYRTQRQQARLARIWFDISIRTRLDALAPATRTAPALSSDENTFRSGATESLPWRLSSLSGIKLAGGLNDCHPRTVGRRGACISITPSSTVGSRAERKGWNASEEQSRVFVRLPWRMTSCLKCLLTELPHPWRLGTGREDCAESGIEKEQNIPSSTGA